MAETVSPFGTPEIITSKQRRSSAGKVTSSNGGKKELPRYLRASTGSCHDLCKYGRKHSSEEKPWRLRFKRTGKREPDEKNEAFSGGTSSDMKKSLVGVKKTQAVDSEKCSLDDPVIIKREMVKSKSKSSGVENPVELRDSVQKKNKSMRFSPKSSTVLESQTLCNADNRKQKILLSHSGRVISRSKETKLSDEHVASLTAKRLRGSNGGKHEDLKTQKNVGVSKVFAKRVSASPRASFFPKASLRKPGNSSMKKSQSLKVAFSSPNQKPVDEQCGDESKRSDEHSVQEKTLHVVKMEDETNKQYIDEKSPPLSSLLTKKVEVQEEYDECTASEAEEYEYEYPSGSNEADTSEEEDVRIGKEKKLRQRNVMDVQDKDGRLRKLKFRRGRVLGEDVSRNGNGSRSFKRREDNGEEEENDGEPTGERVVLRHQDMQEKKDAQGLLNNVIEETANKLVETRKSKVKALVVAFETVISLQESKPSEDSAT